MRLIAHRGNLFGPDPDNENSPTYIMNAVSSGYECEIDAWLFQGRWFLGHDEPKYPISFHFLQINQFWIHLKNMNGVEFMIKRGIDLRYFWHEHDTLAITSNNHIWTCDKSLIGNRTILMLPNEHAISIGRYNNYAGLCNDWIGEL